MSVSVTGRKGRAALQNISGELLLTARLFQIFHLMILSSNILSTNSTLNLSISLAVTEKFI